MTFSAGNVPPIVTRTACARVVASLLAGSLLTLAGCSGDDDDGDASEAVPVLDVGSGGGASRCLLVDEELSPEVSELPVVSCNEFHTHEVYAVVDYDEQDVYPGLTALEEFAERECLGAFESFVGVSAFDSSLVFSWLVPSLSGWTDEDDRDVLCVLADGEGRQLTRSMRGAQL